MAKFATPCSKSWPLLPLQTDWVGRPGLGSVGILPLMPPLTPETQPGRRVRSVLMVQIERAKSTSPEDETLCLPMISRGIFNLQVFACFVFGVSMCLRSIRRPVITQPETLSLKMLAIGILIILIGTAAIYASSLRDPFLSDDYILIKSSPDPSLLLRSLTVSSGDGAMRPVGNAVFGIFKVFANETPIRWHLLGLMLHLANTGLVLWLCIRLGFSRLTSLLVACLFGVHPVHPEVVVWVSATFDLLATFFVLSTLIALTFSGGVIVLIVVPLLTALAILSKESAYALPVIALLLTRKNRLGLLLCSLVAMALFINRWHVFGGPGGYVDIATGRSLILTVTPVFIAKALAYQFWLPLLAPINWAVTPGLIIKILLCMFYVMLGYIAVTAKRVERSTLYFLAAVVVSLIPPLHLALVGRDLQGSRVLYLGSVFFCMWLANLPHGRLLMIFAIAFSTLELRHNLAIRSDVAKAGELACFEGTKAAQNNPAGISVYGLPRSVDGVFFFANGFPDCVRSASKNPGISVVLGHSERGSTILNWSAETRLLTQQP
jgi:hypothetical protein